MGWARITHPFHPLRGQNFKVLKARKVSGADTLILQDTDRGTFAVLREWTDQADPPLCCGAEPSILSLPCLVQLLDIVRRAAAAAQKVEG